MWPCYLVSPFLRLTLLILITCKALTVPSVANEAPSPQGELTVVKKNPDVEARTLWETGQKAFEKKDYETASQSLTKLVERFPGNAHVAQSRLWLGKSFLELNEPDKAQSVLQAYIQSLSPHPSTFAARVQLARAYTQGGKHQEALLTTLEILEAPSKITIPDVVRWDALLIKAHAHIALQQMDRAKRALDAFWADHERKRKPTPPVTSERLAEAHALELQLETDACDHLKPVPEMEEGSVRAVLENRGTCLLQSLGRFQQVLKLGGTRSLEPALQMLQQAYADYRTSCIHPPQPAPSQKRSDAELARYQKELQDVLIQDCREKTKQALSLLDGSSAQIPKKQRTLWKKLKEELQFQTASSQ